jgi:ABC-type phosphate transport system auxiliary subunit
MVKRNSNETDNLHAKPYILEEKDIEFIKSTLEKVRLEEANFSNPSNARKGLYINISSNNRSDLYSDQTNKNLNKIAEEFKSTSKENIDKGNFPEHKEAEESNHYSEDFYTLAIWFRI